MGAEPTRPFTVASLAERWECSEGAIRARIKAGELATFRIGALIRIPATEVERVECPNTASNDCEADMRLSGPTKTASAVATVLPPPIGFPQRRKPSNGGAAGTVTHGPWSA